MGDGRDRLFCWEGRGAWGRVRVLFCVGRRFRIIGILDFCSFGSVDVRIYRRIWMGFLRLRGRFWFLFFFVLVVLYR